MIETLRSCGDVSSLSDELAYAIADGGDEYHLSHGRANIARLLRLDPSLRVLEVGGESGALTRHLAERCGVLDVLVSDEESATAVQERVRGLDHVTVHHGETQELITSLSNRVYDLVVAIEPRGGRLLAARNGDELLHALHTATALLAPSGTLLTAMSNPSGVRYVAGGVSPTHTRPFDALEEHESTALWTPAELAANLTHVGLSTFRFGVFPDHHFVQCLIADAAYGALPQLARDLPEFPSPRRPGDVAGVDEASMWRLAHRGGFARDLANSSLIVASRTDAAPLLDPTVVAWHFPATRLPSLSTMVEFRVGPDGAQCRRRLLNSPDEREVHVTENLTWRATEEPIYMGTPLATVALESPSVSDALRPWLARLAEAPPGSLDAQPWNLMVTADAMPFFDQEWHDASATTDEIALRGLLYMGMRYSATRAPGKAADTRTVLEVITSWADSLGIAADRATFDRVLAREVRIISAVTTSTADECDKILRTLLASRVDAGREVRVDMEVRLLRDHLERLTSHLPTMELSRKQFRQVARREREDMKGSGVRWTTRALHRVRWTSAGPLLSRLRHAVRLK